ncbi:DUF6270 domain-containing protein [Pseudomonas putida]|nr:DUF6270 domain-containing protein [Pseudomonas putida]
MTKNLMIYGSCVSRDIFNLEESRTFKLSDYFARSSMASLCSPPYQNEEALNRIPSAFRRRMVAYDFSKQLLTETEKLNDADVILIDLIDERFDLVVLPSGHIITNSSELTESGLLADSCVDGYELIKHGSKKRRELWLQGMQKLLDLLESHGKLDAVIINKVYWASHFEHPTDAQFPVSFAATEKANQELDWMYNELEKRLEKHQFLQFSPDIMTADEKHRWGISPFHYSERYYKEALALLNTVVTSDNYVESLPITLPLVSKGAKITVAAYKTQSEVFAHCSLVLDGKIHESGNFAFYLLIDGDRHAARWYEATQSARFPIPETSGEISIVAFYQDPKEEKISSQCIAKVLEDPEQ